MKHKALRRIILWSILLVFLLFVFLGFLFTPTASWRSKATAATEPALAETLELVTAPTEAAPIAHGVTPGQVIVYSSPDTNATQIAVLEKGTTVAIMRQEIVDGEQWEFIGSPTTGWIRGNQMISSSVAANLETIYGTVTATAVNVRAYDSTDSAIVGTLHKGDQLVIGRIHNTTGIEWGFLTSPFEGWICMEYVQITDAPAQEEPSPASPDRSQVVSRDTDIYASPNTGGTKLATINAGSSVSISREETVNGTKWAYITKPQAGWILTDGIVTVETFEESIAETAGSTPSEVIMLRKSEIHSAPSPDADKVPLSQLYPGDHIHIDRSETVNGENWLYVTSPKTGWVPAECADVGTPAVADADGITAIVKEDLNVASAATMEANVSGSVAAGQEVTVNREVTFPSGETWAFITVPVEGWIRMDKLSVDTSIAGLTFTAELEPNRVKDIEIEWAAGDILILPIDTDKILIREETPENSKDVMVWKQDGSELSIKFSEEDAIEFFGINDNSVVSKDLTIYVPRNWSCNSLELDAAKATITVNDLTIREVEIDTASGQCTFNDCIVTKLDLDTASGDVHFAGELTELDCDAASANIRAVLFNVPQRMDLDTMSGDLDITLPENAGFTLTLDAMNSDFTSEFDTTLKNKSYVAGNGSCRINVDAMSGSVTIRKG